MIPLQSGPVKQDVDNKKACLVDEDTGLKGLKRGHALYRPGIAVPRNRDLHSLEILYLCNNTAMLLTAPAWSMTEIPTGGYQEEATCRGCHLLPWLGKHNKGNILFTTAIAHRVRCSPIRKMRRRVCLATIIHRVRSGLFRIFRPVRSI